MFWEKRNKMPCKVKIKQNWFELINNIAWKLSVSIEIFAPFPAQYWKSISAELVFLQKLMWLTFSYSCGLTTILTDMKAPLASSKVTKKCAKKQEREALFRLSHCKRLTSTQPKPVRNSIMHTTTKFYMHSTHREQQKKIQCKKGEILLSFYIARLRDFQQRLLRYAGRGVDKDRSIISVNMKIIVACLVLIANSNALKCYLDNLGETQPKEGEKIVTDNFKVFDCNLMRLTDEKVSFYTK